MQQYARLAALAVLLLYQTRLASPYNSNPYIWPLDPWEINRLQITAPAPGQSGSIDIDLAISNPNTVSAGPAPHAAGSGYIPFTPSAANCTASAVSGADALTEATCAETTEFSYGVFAVDGAITDPRSFGLAFSLNYNVSRWGGVMYKVYDATAHLEVGQDLADGVCDGASGTCEYELLAGSTPILVQPTMTDCKGYCQMPPASANTGACSA
ncbi:hypothetical protein F4818DRAFT_439493 [Hypoxylon cercidicola]|nr:hypothetical protein F4818DRAFT_439493 [Hypoxylon cercidicola]